MAVFNQDRWIEGKDGSGRRLYTSTKKQGKDYSSRQADIF